MNKFLISIIALGALVIGVLSFKHLTKPVLPEQALYYKSPRNIAPFEFTDNTGKAFTNESLLGKWSLVFFGYTSCPDVCPTTLQNFNFIYDDLKGIADNTQILLVSVDPKRDTQEKLSKYIAYFNSEFIALRADHGTLFPFSRNLGLMYSTDAKSEEDLNYFVDHSASIVLINPEGKVIANFKPEEQLGAIPSINGEQFTADYEKVINLAN
ncbi:MAG: SCO family protein [Colwellia sp.]